MEKQIGDLDMPPRPEMLQILRDFMLLDGPGKITQPWKNSDPMTVVSCSGDTKGESSLTSDHRFISHYVSQQIS